MGYSPDDDLCCGAAEAASDGFFDTFNTPSWDTWVALTWRSDRCWLVSWVPPEWTLRAGAGIDVNPEQCIQWLDDFDWRER